MPDPILASFRRKTEEQLDRLDHLLAMVPGDQARSFRPHPQTTPLGSLLGHLLECIAGLCAAQHALRPGELASFEALRGLPVNHDCGVTEARERVARYRAALQQGFEVLTDADLTRSVATRLAPEGQTGATLLLQNLEHLINHKYQLFLYLKLLGVPVGTPDLYCLPQGPPPTT